MDWKKTAERLASIAGEDWLPKRLSDRIDSVERLFVACSGGADSVFLSLFFAGLSRRKTNPGELTVLHFNHKLRGEESEKDERFVRDICGELGVAFVSDSWSRDDDAKAVSEEQARDARMNFFAKAIGSTNDDAAILTGHHADDIAETMLMRLSRGSGLQGLSAPREYSVGARGLRFIRPLLGLRKEQIVEWLEQAGATWREDASNREDVFYRNRLRKVVIPEWENASDRSPQTGAAQSRAFLEEDWRALDDCFEKSWLDAFDGEGTISWEKLLAMPRAFQRRTLNRLVSMVSKNGLTLSSMEALLEALRTGSTFKASVEGSHWISGSPESGRVEMVAEERVYDWSLQALPMDVSLCLPGGGLLRVREIELDRELKKEIRSGSISHDQSVFLSASGKQSCPLWVRPWSPGDAYRPMGRDASVKLKELFIDRKIPKQQRRLLPILVSDEGEILWAPGLPPNKGYRIGDNTTRALQLTYSK